jgi:hypothetical protein
MAELLLKRSTNRSLCQSPAPLGWAFSSAPSIARARWLGTLNTKLTRVTSAARGDAYAEVDLGYDVPSVRFLPIAHPETAGLFYRDDVRDGWGCRLKPKDASGAERRRFVALTNRRSSDLDTLRRVSYSAPSNRRGRVSSRARLDRPAQFSRAGIDHHRCVHGHDVGNDGELGAIACGPRQSCLRKRSQRVMAVNIRLAVFNIEEI